MIDNALKTSWNDDKATLGLWLGSPDPIGAETLGSLDFDYICADLQHGLIDYGTTLPLLQAIRHSKATPIARAPWNEPGIIGKLLDAGSMGIIIPMVNTPEEAEQAVRSCRYAPRGARSFGPARAAAVLGANYASEANEKIACIPMIETAEAIGNLDAILDVEGIDAVYIGPADLSISLGLPPGSDNEAQSFVDAVDAVLAGCAKRGIAAGIHSVPDVANKRLDQGFKMVTIVSDGAALATGARAAIKQVRSGGGSGSSDQMY